MMSSSSTVNHHVPSPLLSPLPPPATTAATRVSIKSEYSSSSSQVSVNDSTMATSYYDGSTGSVPNPISMNSSYNDLENKALNTTTKIPPSASSSPSKSSGPGHGTDMVWAPTSNQTSSSSSITPASVPAALGPVTTSVRIAASGGIRHNINRPPAIPMNVVSDSSSVSTIYTNNSLNSNRSSSNNFNNTNGSTTTMTTDQKSYTYAVNESSNMGSHKSPRLSSTSFPRRKMYTSSAAAPTATDTNNRITTTSSSSLPQSLSLSNTATAGATTTHTNINTTKTTNTILQQHQLQSTNVTERRQKRLERNRESARLSRRRRKQYLEILEDRVNFLSEEMDRGRREHALTSVATIQAMRDELIASSTKKSLCSSTSSASLASTSSVAAVTGNISVGTVDQEDEKSAHVLTHSLSRTSRELMLCITFGREYLKSLSVPTSNKFMLWLTLQNDAFYRGGRAASERLSAARIGEKMLSCGHNRVPPSNGMWPLFCNEIGLSYDQEERVRILQRELIMRHESWLHRHTALSSEFVFQSSHNAIMGSCESASKREKKVMDILTPEQKLKFFAWKAKKDKAKMNQLAKALLSKLSFINGASPEIGPINYNNCNGSTMNTMNTLQKPSRTTFGTHSPTSITDFEPSRDQHDATNLYIINHKFISASKSFPKVTQFSSSPTELKRLSRRPSFESLAAVNEEGNNDGNVSGRGANKKGSKKMLRASSSGTLKRCFSEMSCDESGMMNRSASGHSLSSVNAITPEAAQMTSYHVVSAALGAIRSIIPPTTFKSQYTSTVTNPTMTGGTPQEQPTPVTIMSSNTTVIHGNNSHSHNIRMSTSYQPQAVQHQSSYQIPSNVLPLESSAQENNNLSSSQQHTQYSQFLPITNTTTNYTQPAQITSQNASFSNYQTAVSTSSVNSDPISSSEPTPSVVLSMNPITYTKPSPVFGSNPSNYNNNQNFILSTSVSAPVINYQSSVPSPLNIVEEPNNNLEIDESMLQPYRVEGGEYHVGDDSLFELTEEDWAIGEGAFLDL